MRFPDQLSFAARVPRRARRSSCLLALVAVLVAAGFATPASAAQITVDEAKRHGTTRQLLNDLGAPAMVNAAIANAKASYDATRPRLQIALPDDFWDETLAQFDIETKLVTLDRIVESQLSEEQATDLIAFAERPEIKAMRDRATQMGEAMKNQDAALEAIVLARVAGTAPPAPPKLPRALTRDEQSLVSDLAPLAGLGPDDTLRARILERTKAAHPTAKPELWDDAGIRQAVEAEARAGELELATLYAKDGRATLAIIQSPDGQQCIASQDRLAPILQSSVNAIGHSLVDLLGIRTNEYTLRMMGKTPKATTGQRAP